MDDGGAPEMTPVRVVAADEPLKPEKAPLSAAAVRLALQDDQWTFAAPGSPRSDVAPGVYRYLRGARGPVEASCRSRGAAGNANG